MQHMEKENAALLTSWLLNFGSKLNIEMEGMDNNDLDIFYLFVSRSLGTLCLFFLSGQMQGMIPDKFKMF